MTKTTWADKLKRRERVNKEKFAKVIMGSPSKSTLLHAVPYPGVVLILGGRGKGKSALASEIMSKFHDKRQLGGAFLFPNKLSSRQKKALPSWIKIVASIDALPKNAVCIIDEAAQVAHARRAQSESAIKLDNLISISRHRHQLLLVIVHHSRKLDVNVIHDSDRIIWKQPTEAHALFERDEIQIFCRNAIDFFDKLKTDRQRLSHCYVMDFHRLQFLYFKNNLPDWWCEELSESWA